MEEAVAESRAAPGKDHHAAGEPRRRRPTVPMATYADLYDEPDAGPPEGRAGGSPPGASRSAAALVGTAHPGGAMNVVDLILELGRWGQTHRTEMLTGLLGLPLAPRRGQSRLARPAARPPPRTARPGGRRLGKYGRRGSMDARAWCWGGSAAGCSVTPARRTCCWWRQPARAKGSA